MIRWLIALPCAVLASAALSAQATVTSEQAAAAAEEAYGPVDTRAKPACAASKPGGEIVVCGNTEDRDKYRVKSSEELDPSKTRDVVPRAPDLYHLPVPPMVGVGISAQGCFIPPCPARMPLLIDLKAIPEAPPGSDAARVASGLAPRGTPEAPAPPAATPAPAEAGRAATPPAAASPAVKPSG